VHGGSKKKTVCNQAVYKVRGEEGPEGASGGIVGRDNIRNFRDSAALLFHQSLELHEGGPKHFCSELDIV